MFFNYVGATEALKVNIRIGFLKDIYREHWKQVQVLSDIFWKHWQNEYLRTLQTRRKWRIEHSNVKPGDVILLGENNVKRGDWPMGIIETVIHSDDGLVRSACIKAKSVLPINVPFLKLCCY